MTTATQTLELVDELVKAKIPKKTATKLIDYVDNRHNGNIDERLTNMDKRLTNMDKRLIKVETSITFLKWITGIGFTITTTIATALPLYLHNNTQTDMQAMEKRSAEQMQAMEKRNAEQMQAMEKRSIERHNELKRLIQKGK